MSYSLILWSPTIDLYEHIRVLIAILVGLCIATLLNGFARFIQHPRRDRVSVLHLGWALSLLLWIIHFWWWEFRLNLVQEWNFSEYIFVLTYPILFFALSSLLFPLDVKDYVGFEEYFISRRRWFFGLLAATFIADILDAQIKGSAFLHSFGAEYPIRIAVNLAICLAGVTTSNRHIQFALLYVSLIYHVFVIVKLYYTIG